MAGIAVSVQGRNDTHMHNTWKLACYFLELFARFLLPFEATLIAWLLHSPCAIKHRIRAYVSKKGNIVKTKHISRAKRFSKKSFQNHEWRFKPNDPKYNINNVNSTWSCLLCFSSVYALLIAPYSLIQILVLNNYVY